MSTYSRFSHPSARFGPLGLGSVHEQPNDLGMDAPSGDPESPSEMAAGAGIQFAIRPNRGPGGPVRGLTKEEFEELMEARLRETVLKMHDTSVVESAYRVCPLPQAAGNQFIVKIDPQGLLAPKRGVATAPPGWGAGGLIDVPPPTEPIDLGLGRSVPGVDMLPPYLPASERWRNRVRYIWEMYEELRDKIANAEWRIKALEALIAALKSRMYSSGFADNPTYAEDLYRLILAEHELEALNEELDVELRRLRWLIEQLNKRNPMFD